MIDEKKPSIEKLDLSARMILGKKKGLQGADPFFVFAIKNLKPLEPQGFERCL